MNRLLAIIVFATAAQAAVAGSAGKDSRRAPGSLMQPVAVSGLYFVDVTTSFEDVVNLSVATLPATGLLSVAGDAARLPGLVVIPAAFPVRVDIEPTPLPVGALEFNGVADVTLRTENLPYSPDTRLRLFSAHNDGDPFIDITEEITEGSYRVRGSRGEFSQFIIAEDNRDPAVIVNLKFTRVNDLLTTYQSQIDPGLYSSLVTLITNAETNWSGNNVDAAKSGVQSFESAISSGAALGQVPNHWVNDDSVINVAGLLRAAAGTLLFSLEDARDSDLDGVYDFADNCLTVANPSQCNTDGDSFGNHCDADLDNNNIVNSFDLTAMRAAFGATGSNDADLNCNGIVNSFDLTIMRAAFGQPPGP